MTGSETVQGRLSLYSLLFFQPKFKPEIVIEILFFSIVIIEISLCTTGQPFCTPRKRQRVCGSQPVDKLVQQLKELACPAYWVGSPPTVEVFWPEDAGGGSWWRARVLKVIPVPRSLPALPR
jgi:hypothetical protein